MNSLHPREGGGTASFRYEVTSRLEKSLCPLEGGHRVGDLPPTPQGAEGQSRRDPEFSKRSLVVVLVKPLLLMIRKHECPGTGWGSARLSVSPGQCETLLAQNSFASTAVIFKMLLSPGDRSGDGWGLCHAVTE